MNVMPTLRINKYGKAGRFVIKNEEDKCWNGKRFSDKRPRLYADHNVAARDAQVILQQHFKGIKPTRYVVPMFVDVFSHDPVHLAKLAQFLSVASKFHIATHKHGHGPDQSLVQTTIDWGQIEEVQNE